MPLTHLLEVSFFRGGGCDDKCVQSGNKITLEPVVETPTSKIPGKLAN